jgi:Flp pilus assembly pilin Flp
MKSYRFQRAQSLTEYILLVFLIALVAYAAVSSYGKKVRGRFISGGNKLQTLHVP